MSQPVKKYYTPEEYLTFEEQSEEKHEYYRGEIYLMSGGSGTHSRISGNILAYFKQVFRRRDCDAFDSNLRILVRSNGLYTYPDVSVVCGPLQYAGGRTDTITNPILIVEVLSPSTASYDRGKKFRLYEGLETLQDYILVEQDEVAVAHYHRSGAGQWTLIHYRNLDTALALPHLAMTLPLEEIYFKVEFEGEK